VSVISGHPQVLRDALTRADAVIAKPFAIDTLLTEVNRSGWQAVNAAVIYGSRHTSGEADRPVRSRRGW
jgi:hypothetical protein